MIDPTIIRTLSRRQSIPNAVRRSLRIGRNWAKASDKAVDLRASRRFESRQTRRAFVDATRIKRATSAIARLPSRGETIHLMLRGDFNAWDVVPGMLSLVAPARLAELWIATIGFSRRNADELVRLIDAKQVKFCSFICSHFYASHESDVCQKLARSLAERGGRFLAIRCHAKILLFKTAERRPRFFVTESSANLRSCRNIEQMALYQSKGLFRFHRDWMRSVGKPAEATDG